MTSFSGVGKGSGVKRELEEKNWSTGNFLAHFSAMDNEEMGRSWQRKWSQRKVFLERELIPSKLNIADSND
jgi:hypothetical protein